jgi:hypothetical protein
MSWKLCFRLSGTPPKHGINNVLRAIPRKLCFPIWGKPPELGTYSCQGATSLVYGVPPPHSMLEEDSRYPRNACSWYSNSNILAPQYLGISTCTARDFGTRRSALCTHSTQNLQGRLRRPKGLKLRASLSLSPTRATIRDMG